MNEIHWNRIFALYETVQDVAKDILKRLRVLDDSFYTAWNKCIPNLPPQATQKQCRQAEAQLKQEFQAVHEKYRQEFLEHMEPRLTSQLKLYSHVIAMMTMRSIEESGPGPFVPHLRQLYVERELEDFENMSVLSRDLDHTHLLLQRLQEMVDGQSDEIRKWYLTDLAERYGSHVTAYTAKQRHVTMSLKPSTLPTEIMLAIYSYCDIETCCILRQVNTHWNSVFYEMEALLHSKLALRHPWIVPDGQDLKTYADCVLVFNARLKWPHVDDIDTLRMFPVEGTASKPVPTVPLEQGETLPATFSTFRSGTTVLTVMNWTFGAALIGMCIIYARWRCMRSTKRL